LAFWDIFVVTIHVERSEVAFTDPGGFGFESFEILVVFHLLKRHILTVYFRNYIRHSSSWLNKIFY